MAKLNRLRVASLQYFIRPVKAFEEFEEQVAGLIETAADYKCQLIVFPEYFSIQLLTLGNVKRPIREQVRDLAKQSPRIVEMLQGLSAKYNIHIVGGTTPVLDSSSEKVLNRSHIISPSGALGTQDKLHMTRFEKEDWIVHPGKRLKIFDTDFGKVAIAICYDSEFPEIARTAARAGATILFVPSCTDDRQGFLRVRLCAHARAIENQMYVIQSSTVGSLPMVPAVSLNYGQASILTPSDFVFSRDGILAEGIPNQETMVIGELNLELIETSRSTGTVLPLLDSQKTAELTAEVDMVTV
jgi:predicted amidohydrolase